MKKATKFNFDKVWGPKEWLQLAADEYPGTTMSVAEKKAVVLELTRYGCKPDGIAKACGFGKEFVYKTVEEFAHRCVAERVKETANGKS